MCWAVRHCLCWCPQSTVVAEILWVTHRRQFLHPHMYLFVTKYRYVVRFLKDGGYHCIEQQLLHTDLGALAGHCCGSPQFYMLFL